MERLASGTFITTSNTEVRLSYNGEGLEEKLRNESSRAVGQLRFIDEHGTEYKLADLLKDSGFGGVGSRLKHEEAAIALLQQRIDIEKHNHSSDIIPIHAAGICYFVAGVESTTGTPKSDFHFVDGEGREVLWASHKAGKSPRCFQQWAGCSAKVEPNIYNHWETREFADHIRRVEFSGGTTVARPIADRHLQSLAVYGNGFGGEFGRNNVQLVIQGSPSLAANTANVHYDIVSHSVHANGGELPEEYAPTFMAMYRGDRNDFGIINCRVGISPKKARLISNWIQDNEQSGSHPAHRGPVVYTAGDPDPESVAGGSVVDNGTCPTTGFQPDD